MDRRGRKGYDKRWKYIDLLMGLWSVSQIFQREEFENFKRIAKNTIKGLAATKLLRETLQNKKTQTAPSIPQGQQEEEDEFFAMKQEKKDEDTDGITLCRRFKCKEQLKQMENSLLQIS